MSKASSIQKNKRNLIEYLAIALISLAVQVSVLGLLSLSIFGLAVGTLEGAVFFVLILGLANSFLIPPLVNFSVRFHPLLFPLLVFIMNGLLVRLIGSQIPGVVISSLGTAIGVSVVVSMTGMIVGGAFAADESASYERFVVQPLFQRYANRERISSPGVMFPSAAQSGIKVNFTPHVVPSVRGILTTAHVFASDDAVETLQDRAKVAEIYREFYRDAHFVRMADSIPKLASVRGSNFCDIAYEPEKGSDRLVVISAIDNLVKGASGQAIQNMNLMAGMDEKAGLWFPGLAP